MSKKRKGYTLIELLAVIVILAVIALIVTPIVTGIIKSAKEQADRRSAEGYVKAAENYFASTLLDKTKKDKLGTNIFDELEVSSKTATKGNVIVDTEGNASWYWTITSYTTISCGRNVSNDGGVSVSDVSRAIGLRAVINVNSSITITGGNGTPSSPYEI